MNIALVRTPELSKDDCLIAAYNRRLGLLKKRLRNMDYFVKSGTSLAIKISSLFIHIEYYKAVICFLKLFLFLLLINFYI